MSELSRHGARSHAGSRSREHSNIPWESQVIGLADDGDNDIDDMPSAGKLACPNCGYRSDSADFQITGGSSGTSDSPSSLLQTPARGDYASRTGTSGSQPTVRAQSAGLANGRQRSIMLASGGRSRQPVRTPDDIVITRSPTGTAVVRHRHGGDLIGEVGRGDDNSWRSLMDGQELSPHVHQRAALQELLGSWNKTAVTPHRMPMPLQAPPPQPDMLSRLGVANVRSFASDDDSDDGDSGGSDDGGGADSNGLTPRGQGIYKKLKARGMSDAQAMAMAKRAQLTKPGQFGKSAAS
jgi:hypothetical protein